MAKYPALKALKKAAGFPLYLISNNSLSVKTSARRHNRENEKCLEETP